MNRHRSPSSPFISLRKALERARAFHRAEGGNAAPPDVAVSHWGYSSLKSSEAPQTLAALRAYGLLEKEGENVRLSERALLILSDETPATRRQALLREAARLPRVHQVILDQFPQGLPSDGTLRSYVEKQLGFNPKSVSGFIRRFKDTLAFAGLPEAPQRDEPPPSPSAPGRETPPSSAPATRCFPLIDGGEVRLWAPRKIHSGEAKQLRMLFDLWLEIVTEPD